MRLALIGPPLSGKSTLFRAVTGVESQPGLGEQRAVVKVPDWRLDWLAQLVGSKKRTYASFELIDLPGFSQASPAEQAEFRKHLALLRQCDGLVAVVRAFEDPELPAYRNRVDPLADLQEIRTEFMLADLEQVANRIEKLRKSLAKPTRTHEQEKRELSLLERCQEALEQEVPLSEVLRDPQEAKMVRAFGFLTEKPLLVVFNVSEDKAAEGVQSDVPYAAANISLCAKIEAELAQLDEEDRKVFLQEYGLTEPARERFIRACMDALGLICFLTAAGSEARAWPVRKGTTAVEAAGEVHSDMARGFIRAETVAFDDLYAAGDFKTAKAQGKVRLEGRDYVVQDGDVILFRFSV